jgi:protein-disulfide isomerase
MLLIGLVVQPVYGEEIYNEYRTMAESKAKGLLVKYFGINAVMHSFDEAPAGLYLMRVSVGGGEQRKMYMLADQTHIIEGALYSPHITDKRDAYGSVSLEAIAEQNTKNNAVLAEFRRAITPKATSSTPASFNLADFRRAITPKATSTTPASFKPVVTGQSIMSALANPVQALGVNAPASNGFDYDDYFKRLSQSHYIEEGDGQGIIYVFFDMECSACIKVHPYVQSMITKHDVRVRYVPVGFQTEESKAKAIITLLSENNEERLVRMNTFIGPKKLTELMDTSFISEAFYLSKEYSSALDRFNTNNTLFYASPRPATPTFAFVSQGKKQLIASATPIVIDNIGKSASLVQQNPAQGVVIKSSSNQNSQ